jgi:hypothetical protein
MSSFPHASLGEEKTNVLRLPNYRTFDGLAQRHCVAAFPESVQQFFYKNVEHQKIKK